MIRLSRLRDFGLVMVLAGCLAALSACRSHPARAAADVIATPTTPASTAMPTSTKLAWQTGINRYTLEVDATPREFLIYVPAAYDPTSATPVVFMFHGSNQSGRIMYERTGWADKADQEGFIVVYPTSWKYRTTEAYKVEDKWNVPRMAQMVAPGTELKDDVKFVRVMIETVQAGFTVDTERIYASGFSNGGGFVLTRLVPEMHDTFAAFSTSGAGLWGEGKIENPPTDIHASIYSILGNQDEKLAENNGHPLPLPMNAEEMEQDAMLGQMFQVTTSILSLSPDYEVTYDRQTFTTITFGASLIGRDNRYVFRMVNHMGHVYPSGDNNRAGIDAADLFWDFFASVSGL